MSTKKVSKNKISTFTLGNFVMLVLCVILTFSILVMGLALLRTVTLTPMRVSLMTEKCDKIATEFGNADFEGTVVQLAAEYGVQVIVFAYPEDRVDFETMIINTSPYTPSQSNVSAVADEFYQDMVNTCVLNMINTGEISSCDVYQTNYYDISFIVYYRLINIGASKYFMYCATPLTMVNDPINILDTQLIIASAIAFAVSLIMAGFMALKISRPIKGLSTNAFRLSKGDYTVFFDGNGSVEIDRLAECLNFATSQMKQTQTLRQDVIANVSHDLKTPLTLIKSYAELLKDFPDAPIKKREERLDMIVSEADRMTRLVNEMLRLAKEESGVVPINKVKFDLSELVTSVVAAFSIKESQGYKFDIQIDKNLFVSADKSQIEKVLHNYIQNAVNYTGKDLKVKITLKDINGNARFDVIDTGKGIAEDEREKIWDRYYRASKQYTRGSGTGLGLSIVKNILTRHGFGFGVNSVVGKGSDFFFEIPIVSPPESDESK